MDRDRLVPLVLALLAVVALGVSAATLDSTTGSGTGLGSGPTAGPGDGRFSLGSPAVNATTEAAPVDETIIRILVTALLVLGFVALAYSLYDDPWDTIALVLVGAFVVAVALLVLYQLLAWLGSGGGGLLGQGTFGLPGGGLGDLRGSTAVDTAVEQRGIVLVGLLVVVLVVAGVVLVRATGDDASAGDPEPPEQTTEPSLAAVGAVAGQAADAIQSTSSVENAVYRAWSEMTEHLDVERPETSTPREFEVAAVEAGMRPDDVRELTELFEATRYGGAAVTADRADQAVAALRRIERSYTDGVETGRDANWWDDGVDG